MPGQLFELPDRGIVGPRSVQKSGIPRIRPSPTLHSRDLNSVCSRKLVGGMWEVNHPSAPHTKSWPSRSAGAPR